MLSVAKHSILVLSVFLGSWSAVSARENVPLSAILPQFFVDGVQLGNESGSHSAHFQDQGDALNVMAQIDATLAAQFGTYPLASSSGAFTFTLDPETGSYLPTSESFGPIFAERPETLGKKKTNLGLTNLNYHFDSLEGFQLDEGSIDFTLTHEDEKDIGEPGNLSPYYEGDIIDSRLSVKLKLNTTIVFENFGVTDRLDLGVAIPYVRADMEATIHDTILPIASGGGLHEFPGAKFVQDRTRKGHASGIGDVVLRGKYNFKKGFAFAGDLRLPTGDEENLLGSGATQLRLLLIARGPKYEILRGIYPHLNLGYTASHGAYTIPVNSAKSLSLKVDPSDEINYAAGLDAALSSRVTFAVDLLGRVLLGAQNLSVRDRELLYRAGCDVGCPIEKISRPELVTTKGDVSLLTGTAGVKINVAEGVLISVSGLVPILKDRGLQANFAGSVGIDYTF